MKKYTILTCIIGSIFFSVIACASESFGQNITAAVNGTKSGKIHSACELTVPTVQGPFYKEGSPEKNGTKFANGIEGERLVITGKVLNFFTCKPISGAILDFWQADSNGTYDIEGFNLRGKIISDENGNYTLETIIPGPEMGQIQGREFVRPEHIHVKAWIPNNPGNVTLVTQFYFPDDPYRDEFVKDQLVLKPVNKNGTKFANFDIILEDNREIYDAIVQLPEYKVQK